MTNSFEKPEIPEIQQSPEKKPKRVEKPREGLYQNEIEYLQRVSGITDEKQKAKDRKKLENLSPKEVAAHRTIIQEEYRESERKKFEQKKEQQKSSLEKPVPENKRPAGELIYTPDIVPVRSDKTGENITAGDMVELVDEKGNRISENPLKISAVGFEKDGEFAFIDGEKIPMSRVRLAEGEKDTVVKIPETEISKLEGIAKKEEVPLKIGDGIQWTINGSEQFKPEAEAEIVGFSNNGKLVRISYIDDKGVEKEDTAPIEQITVREKGGDKKTSGEELETKNEAKDVPEETPFLNSEEKERVRDFVFPKFISSENNKKIGAEAAKTIFGVAASIAGVKSFFDVPAYLYQRFKVRGMFGHGEGLSGSIENITKASLKRHGKNGGGRSTVIRDAIEDLEKRLALTKEGSIKNSEQRKMLAKILSENRIREKSSSEERGTEIKKILDNYTTTKITGMQAIRESLNTALVASGAFSLRGVSYGLFDAVGRYQRLDKEATRKGEKVDLKNVFVGAFTETFRDAALQNKDHPKLSAVKAWGNILRYVGIGEMAAFHQGGLSGDMDKVLNTFSGKISFGNTANNFQGNMERTINGLRNVTHMFGRQEQPHVSIDVHGSHTLWNAINKSMREVYGDKFAHLGANKEANEALKTWNIDKVKNMIAHDPEKYGLKAGVNINKLSAKELENINYEKAFNELNTHGGLRESLTKAQIEHIDKDNALLKNFMHDHSHTLRAGTDHENVLKENDLSAGQHPEEVAHFENVNHRPYSTNEVSEANADFNKLNKAVTAFKIFENRSIPYEQKMDALRRIISDGERIRYNEFDVLRKGKNFFLESGYGEMPITKNDIGKLVRIAREAEARGIDIVR